MAERMLKEQRERPTPIGFRFTIDEQAHEELRTAQMERITGLFTPLTSSYSLPHGHTELEWDDEELVPTPPEERTDDPDQLAYGNHAADVIKAARTR